MWVEDRTKVYTPVPRAERNVEVEAEPESSGPPSPALSAVESSADPEDRPSFCYLMAINSFNFSYSLVAATLGVVILPSEAVVLFPSSHAVMLGVMLGCTGVTQLIGPASAPPAGASRLASVHSLTSCVRPPPACCFMRAASPTAP